MTGTQNTQSLKWLLDHTLPLNRKERYYTGTVLTGIVCGDDMKHLHRLTDLMGFPGVDVRGDPADCGLVFFTEYGVAESVFGPARDRFEQLPTDRDTPDVVFLTSQPTPVLFALEAKLYDRPSGFDLRAQLDRQAGLLADLATRLASWLDVPDVPVAHFALLPEPQANVDLGDAYPVITWQQLHAVYVDVAPAYWLAVLDEALSRYDDLVTRFKPNDDARLTGTDIFDAHQDGTLGYTAMGRTGGLTGSQVRADVDSGNWRDVQYQVARVHPGNRNWFSVADFIELVAAPSDPTPEEAHARFSQAVSQARSVGTRVFGDASILDQLDLGSDLLRDAPPAELARIAVLFETASQAALEARRESSDLWDRLRQG
jgi:rubredoxin